MTRKEAKEFIKSLLNIRTSADDKLSSGAPGVYPTMKYNGQLIEVGTRINWNGTIKKAAVDIWDTEENNPEKAPNLWANLDYKNGVRIIPEVITVTTAFDLDELGYWKDGKIYKSLKNDNVYTPEQYAANWEVQE